MAKNCKNINFFPSRLRGFKKIANAFFHDNFMSYLICSHFFCFSLTIFATKIASSPKKIKSFRLAVEILYIFYFVFRPFSREGFSVFVGIFLYEVPIVSFFWFFSACFHTLVVKMSWRVTIKKLGPLKNWAPLIGNPQKFVYIKIYVYGLLKLRSPSKEPR